MPTKLRHYLQPGLVGLRSNVVPGLIIQACALLILLGYLLVPAFHTWLSTIGTLKARYGYLYSLVSTAVFGGLIPFLVLLQTRQVPPAQRRSQLAFYLLFWAWRGIEVDALYRLQGWMFGTSATVSVVVPKVFVDQFVYNPVWAVPSQVICFLWKDAGFSWVGVRRRFELESLGHRVVVILLSTWMVWLPAVAIVYCLPAALQLPISNLVLSFWCLLLSFISRRAGAEPG